MDPYLFTLCLGFGGLFGMAALGLGHHAHGGHAHHGGGHHPNPAGHGGKEAPGSHPHAVGKDASGRPVGAAGFLALLSPRILFSLLLGFGAAGLLLRPLALPSWALATLAAAGGLMFERGLVQPLWKLLFGFASRPARTLESAVLEEGEAVTNFDADGHGLISFQLDGQVRQILATLCAEDRTAGLRVRAGDRLFIQAVDARRNRCTVSKLR